MKRFSDLILLPFKYLLLLISYLFPRTRRIWCFGSVFGGNSKYLFIHMCQNDDETRCIWIARKKDVNTIKSHGFEVYNRWSVKGIWFCLIAGVYVYNSYPSNVNLYTKGRAKLVNLWHGIALKCCDRQIKIGPMAKRYQSKRIVDRLRYLNFRLRPDIVLSTSPAVTCQYMEAFGVDKSHFIEGIYPRCVLLEKNKDTVEGFINTYENQKSRDLLCKLKQFNYVYVYMPTFRDTGDDFITQSGFDFDRVNNTLKKYNRLFIMKLHPDSSFQFTHDYSNIILVDKAVDIYPILPFTNCLVTDYSSIYCDYILMKEKQIILYIPDFEDYIKKSRELAYPYDDVMRGPRARNFNDLIGLLDCSNPFFNVDGIERVRNLFWNYEYSTMDELVAAIKMKLYE